MSIQALFSQYVERRNFADSSVALKQRAVDRFVECFGELPVSQITQAHAEDFCCWLSSGRGANTVNSFYLANLKPFFKWLVSNGHLRENPFANTNHIKAGKTRRKPFEPEEVERMVKVSCTRWKVIELLGLCSLRRSESLNLEIKDIHFDKGYILVSPKEDTDETWRWSIKNHNQAITPLPKLIRLPSMTVNFHQLLRELIEEVGSKQPYVCVKPTMYQAMMDLKAENKLTWEQRNCPCSNFSRSFRSILKKAKVEPRRYQDLRKTFANTMIRAGMTVKETQMAMRHASSNTTLKYYLEADEEKTIQKANEIYEKFYASCDL
jgi:site-specific recombinase XerD